MIIDNIQQEFKILQNPMEALHLSRFFKTSEGEYGYGDKFLGIRVPITRSLVKKYKNLVTVEDCVTLIQSEWHEMRLCGFLLLIELYRNYKKKKEFSSAERIVMLYISLIEYGNNWDLVDLVSQYILGDWLIDNSQFRYILEDLAERTDSLWHQRVAIVSTFALIRASSFEYTIRISKKFLNHKHDLIHKATGWMLREMGKRGGYFQLISFLDDWATSMPRTMLRYAIERLPEDLRKYYLKLR